MKSKIAGLAIVTFMLTACGQYHWSNAANPNANFNGDLDQCAQEFDQANKPGNGRTTNLPSATATSTDAINEQYIAPVNTGCVGGAGFFGCAGDYPSNTNSIDNCLMSKGWKMRRN